MYVRILIYIRKNKIHLFLIFKDFHELVRYSIYFQIISFSFTRVING